MTDGTDHQPADKDPGPPPPLAFIYDRRTSDTDTSEVGIHGACGRPLDYYQ